MKTDMALPDNHRIDEEKYRSLLKYIRLSVTEKYDFPQEIVQIEGCILYTSLVEILPTRRTYDKSPFRDKGLPMVGYDACLLYTSCLRSTSIRPHVVRDGFSFVGHNFFEYA